MAFQPGLYKGVLLSEQVPCVPAIRYITAEEKGPEGSFGLLKPACIH